MLSLIRFGALAVTLILAASGCAEEEVALEPEQKDYWKQLPPGEMALVKLTDPAQFPDFSEGYHRRKGLKRAAMYSLQYLDKNSSQQFYPYSEEITHARAISSLENFITLLDMVQSGQELDAMLKENFDIYVSRGCDEQGTVLFTGYYRPIFDARMEPDSQFKYPLYKRPADLERDEQTGEYRHTNGGAYYTRAEIMNGALDGRNLELCYLADPFEAYIITVQGSGRLRLADGSFLDVGYHGDNGHEYTSIGQRLVDDGLIEPSDLSLQGLIRFFKNNPRQIDTLLPMNDRYVFFTPREGGPYGSLNVPVTPFRSIATDKEVYPRACVSWLETVIPAERAGEITDHRYRGFAMDQDTGGAIRAAGRCDVFLGTGPRVGELAGRTLSEGKLYYLFIKQ
jgi:membrane-bound lytic murein transglycosylase A